MLQLLFSYLLFFKNKAAVQTLYLLRIILLYLDIPAPAFQAMVKRLPAVRAGSCGGSKDPFAVWTRGDRRHIRSSFELIQATLQFSFHGNVGAEFVLIFMAECLISQFFIKSLCLKLGGEFCPYGALLLCGFFQLF